MYFETPVINGIPSVVALVSHTSPNVTFSNGSSNPGAIVSTTKGDSPVLITSTDYPQTLVIGDGFEVEERDEVMIYIDDSYIGFYDGDNTVNVSLTEILLSDDCKVVRHEILFEAGTLLELAQMIVDSGITSAKYTVCDYTTVYTPVEHVNIPDLWYYGSSRMQLCAKDQDSLLAANPKANYAVFDLQTGTLEYMDELPPLNDDSEVSPHDLSEELDEMFYLFA